MTKLSKQIIKNAIKKNIEIAIKEDLGTSDVTTNLINYNQKARGYLIAKQSGVLCGREWFSQTYKKINNKIKLKWFHNDGDYFKKGDKVCEFYGPYRDLLKGERVAINFLQTLSSVSSCTYELVTLIKKYTTKIYDTRKTIPGLRIAQKYAVLVGGGNNQRMGLYDQILIKENHINSYGSIEELFIKIKQKKLINKIQIEVENIHDFKLALDYNIKNILLDNFSLANIKEAIRINQKRALLEASGNITKKNIVQYAKTGIDRISIGSLTKNIKAIDFSVIIAPV